MLRRSVPQEVRLCFLLRDYIHEWAVTVTGKQGRTFDNPQEALDSEVCQIPAEGLQLMPLQGLWFRRGAGEFGTGSFVYTVSLCLLASL